MLVGQDFWLIRFITHGFTNKNTKVPHSPCKNFYLLAHDSLSQIVSHPSSHHTSVLGKFWWSWFKLRRQFVFKNMVRFVFVLYSTWLQIFCICLRILQYLIFYLRGTSTCLRLTLDLNLREKLFLDLSATWTFCSVFNVAFAAGCRTNLTDR